MLVVNKMLVAFKKLWAASANVEGGRNRILIIVDMLIAYYRHGSSPANYVQFGFNGLTRKERQGFFTFRLSENLMRDLNNPDHTIRFLDKYLFATDFKELLGREFWGGAEIDAIIEGKQKFVVKPRRGMQGSGVIFVDKSESQKAIEELRVKIISSPDEYIIEEAVEQHPDINRMFGEGLLPVRVVTKRIDDKVFIVMCAVTLGTSGKVVNYHTGGIIAPVDEKTGIIIAPALGPDGFLYYKHQVTKESIVGFELPNWTNVIELVKKAALLAKGVGFVGWDVGIVDGGAVLIEGNHNPGTYTMLQHKKIQRVLGRAGIRAQVERLSGNL